MPSDFTWQLLRAGALHLDGGGMFGVVPKSLWSRMTGVDDQNRIPLQTNCLLFEDGEHTVLVETGFGGKWADKERGFYDLEQRTILDALAEINCDPASITHVVVTHLHFDHAAGLTHLDSSNEPISSFPGARIFVQKTEWNDALANKSTMTRTYLRSHLDPIESQLNLIDGEASIIPGTSLAVFPVPGHTWGMHAVRFEDKYGIVCFPGDVMPTRNHVGLAFSMGYDMLPYQNLLTKRALLEQAAAEDWRIVIDHEPGEPLVRVRKQPSNPEAFKLRTT